MKFTAAEILELAYEQQLKKELNEKPTVYGLSDVEDGLRTAIPLTIYHLSDDDTSGIAGLLMPSGEFIHTAPSSKVVKYWEFDETFKYERFVNPDTEEVIIKANSWTSGEVVWNGVNEHNYPTHSEALKAA
jgi:hypothetical protein